MEIEEKYIVCDIETNTLEEFPNAEVDELRYVGFKHEDRHGCFHAIEVDKIQQSLDFFPYIVGHNFKKYDKVILERYGFKIRYDQVIVDTYEIADNRLKSMMYMDLNSGDRSLERLSERLGLEIGKTKFDYSLLKNEYLEGEEYRLLEEYLFNDLNVTDNLFKYFYSLFHGFKEYVSDENKRRMCWLINKPGSTAYKAICNLTGLPEEYGDYTEDNGNLYEGGYVSLPYCDFVEG